MDPTYRKVALAAAILGLVLSLFIALRSGDEDIEPERPTTEIVPASMSAGVERRIRLDVVEGSPPGGLRRASVDVIADGAPGRPRFTADVAERFQLRS